VCVLVAGAMQSIPLSPSHLRGEGNQTHSAGPSIRGPLPDGDRTTLEDAAERLGGDEQEPADV
jgi:hypothetical protein